VPWFIRGSVRLMGGGGRSAKRFNSSLAAPQNQYHMSYFTFHASTTEGPMVVRVVRLGSERVEGEGLRIGTVRRPPRGVPKTHFASRNWYDVWFPNLAPSIETMKIGQTAKSEKGWFAFTKRYRAEMATPENSRTLDLLAALSHRTNFSVGCYCENDARCHRSILRSLLAERGAEIWSPMP
jgi:uncharacterized protein YeaO (DUF488 family)